MSRDSNPLDNDALREIVEGTAAVTGEDFFDALVKHLARATGTKCAWVTEWLADSRRLRAYSFWVGDDYYGDYEYAIEGTPCEPVIENRRLIHVPDRLIDLFSEDPDLPLLEAVSYIGVPLFDTDGRLLGHLAVMHDEPMEEDERVTAIFNIFAGRAAAELRRLRRDKALREREQKLTRLIDNAMDAIVELDGDLCVTRMNPGAEKLFGCAQANMLGKAFDVFLTPASRGQITYLTRELEPQPEGRQSFWIPDGMEIVRAGGDPFPAEATVSRYELEGQSYYTLILRNIDERIDAEERVRTLMNEAAYLREQIDALQGFDNIVGESQALRRVLDDVEQVAGSETTVLITGETGTGKELIARAIHDRSRRAKQALVTVNCAAIPSNLQESEFFGHEKGAFTGATQRREGRFKLAHGGTIFLDEVGELPPDLQAKLLRVLQEGEFEMVGGSRTERVDVRVIAATNRDLEAMVEAGTFRRDLLYRLNVFPLHVPPLRERGDDVVLLAEAFAQRFARQRGGRTPRLTDADKVKLTRYDWPGNVRELENVIERAIITSTGAALSLERALPDVGSSAATVAASALPGVGGADAPAGAMAPGADRILTEDEMRDLERANIVRALDAAGWKISGAGGAAERLGLRPNTLSSRMKSLGIKKPA
jgi:PAS domain S-box-containing protein